MKDYLASVITIFVVSLVMKLLTNDKMMNKLDKKTSSIYKFTVRPGSAVRYIAILAIIVFTGFIVLSYAVREQAVSVYVGFGVFAAFGLFLLIETLPGAEEIHVDHDDIEVQLAWFYKKHWSFSQIDYTVLNPNKGIRVYMKGRKRQAFVVDNMCTGYKNFYKRLEHDNIGIRVKTLTPEETKKVKKKWNIASWLLVIGIVLVCAIVYVLDAYVLS